MKCINFPLVRQRVSTFLVGLIECPRFRSSLLLHFPSFFFSFFFSPENLCAPLSLCYLAISVLSLSQRSLAITLSRYRLSLSFSAPSIDAPLPSALPLSLSLRCSLLTVSLSFSFPRRSSSLEAPSPSPFPLLRSSPSLAFSPIVPSHRPPLALSKFSLPQRFFLFFFSFPLHLRLFFSLYFLLAPFSTRGSLEDSTFGFDCFNFRRVSFRTLCSPKFFEVYQLPNMY